MTIDLYMLSVHMKTEFFALWRAIMLSKNNLMGLSRNILSEARKDMIQISLLVTVAMAQYSTFTKERKTVLNFLIFQEIKEDPKVTKYPMRECHLSGQAP